MTTHPSREGGGDMDSLTPREEGMPAHVSHPAEFIREEMDERDWAIPTMARKMGGDYGINVFALQMYLTLGPNEPGLRLGGMAADIGHAFGVPAQFFQNMEDAWLRFHAAQKAREATSAGEANPKPPTRGGVSE